MRHTGPQWFAADQVFRGARGWFVGSPQGLSVGPYRRASDAQAASRDVQQRISQAKNRGEVIRVVRDFLAGSEEKGNLSSRAGERPKLRFRSDRFLSVDGAWFFMTREGVHVGPYGSRKAAERDSQRLVKILARTEGHEARVLAIHEFMRRPVMYEPVH